jgi:pantoate--beta-alanine ligase
MRVISSLQDIKSYINNHKSDETISLIPTMGNIHSGHVKLIKSASSSSLKIVSIYVNELQFNDRNDYISYPRTLEDDLSICADNNVDLVFTPNSSVVRKQLDEDKNDLPKFTSYMCGANRPGHFSGVYRIVKFLFEILEPNYAYFGKKDFQQLLLIKYIANTYFPKLKIIDVDTVRDSNNVAFSSRLSKIPSESFHQVRLIFQTLIIMKKKLLNGLNFNTIKEDCILELENNNILVEYLDLRSLETLKEQVNINQPCGIFIACYIDNIRLIDNIEI